MNFFSTVVTFMKDGGSFMYIILACGVVIIAISTERLIVIGRAASVNSRKLVDDLVRSASRGDLASARNISRSSNSPVGMVAQAILQAGPAEENVLQSAADDAATLALPPLTRRLSHLGMLANVATLLGLLGTIFGLITSFAGVGAADPAQRSTFLAAGIAQGLNTTAFGLLIAVPALLIHGYLVGLVDSITEQVDEVSIRLTRVLSNMSEGHGTSPLRAVATKPAAQVVPVNRPIASQGGAQ